MSHVPAKRRGRLRSLVVDLEPVRRDRDFRMLWLGDAGAATVAAVAGTQFSVVCGGVLCLAGLLAVLRRFPEPLAYEDTPRDATSHIAATEEPIETPA